MRCPFCSHPESRVLESRNVEDGAVIRRRRKCEQCKQRFTTHERIHQSPLMVVKKDGRREIFDRQKLITAFSRACAKRPVSMDRIERAAQRIEARLRSEGHTEVESKRIGALVMQLLRRIDAVAYIRFASVYQEFDDPSRFEEVLAVLSGEHRSKAPSPPSPTRTRDRGGNGPPSTPGPSGRGPTKPRQA